MQVIKLVTFHTNVATKKFSLVNRIREMVTFDLCKRIKKEVFCCCCKHGKEKKFWVPTRNWPHAHKEKNTFLYFFTELKTSHLSYSIYKHDTVNIADPRSMQDVSLTIEFLWLSGRASELAIWRSEVWFLIVNLVLLSWHNAKTSFPNIFLITVATKIIHFQALDRFSSEKALFPVRMKYVVHYAKPSWCWTYSLNLESSPLRCFW